MNYNQVAERLDEAAKTANSTEQISLEKSFSIEEAYAIQSISIARRYLRGENWVGLKLGFTSKAKMEQMGVHDMIWGRLTDQMYYSNNGTLNKSDFIHPRAEPEIAFRLSKDVTEQINLEKVTDVVDGLCVAIEIIDSRYKNFKFSLEDVIADNCSSAGFILGNWKDVHTNIRDIDMNLSVNGEEIHSGNSNAILGNPWESLVAAIRLGLENGEKLNKGSIILAGAATPAVYIEKGQKIEAFADGLGTVAINIS